MANSKLGFCLPHLSGAGRHSWREELEVVLTQKLWPHFFWREVGDNRGKCDNTVSMIFNIEHFCFG
jgi:hypothetical protein